MLTDSDIIKLKNVFATKQDLIAMEKRLVSKVEFEKFKASNKKEHNNLRKSSVDRKDFSISIGNIAKETVEYINISLNATKNEIVTEIGENIDQLIKELRGILGNHEGRIRRLEDEVLSN